MEGYIGEIFSSFQGEGIYTGKRQIFLRFLGCGLNCCYCDSKAFKKSKIPYLRVEKKPGTKEFSSVKNPISSDIILGHINRLVTKDLHSVSFTGGEPLSDEVFLESVAKKCRKAGLKNYLETSGASSKKFEKVIEFFDYAAIDIKLPNHNAVPNDRWDKLYENELDCIKISLKKNIETIVKVVILKSTKIEEFERICKDLKSISSGIPFYFVIQPATKIKSNEKIKEPSIEPSTKEVFRISEVAGRYIDNVSVIWQIHKLMDIL